jgi:hypothetical protein
MTKRPTPTGVGKSASLGGGPSDREYCNASNPFLRCVCPRRRHARDPKGVVAGGPAEIAGDLGVAIHVRLQANTKQVDAL